ncbi:hypothetical protein [Rhodospirillum centenum]|uniref:Uncharacterized protein n=1 Tax=Rhodospirillum centenum (strain ATCC 51521 / SW) TaxID=414684 RepID=B6ISF5_RHOCS|nr:hypothetical protein [Rhodospirillum centenum]ACI98391.1 conserved hypothetical protein [Rhodospirillum centenum SW]
MTPSRFADLLDRLGPCLDTWPDRERDAALALLDSSEAARRDLEAATLLADILPDLPRVDASPSLRSAVLALPLEHPRMVAPRGLAAWLDSAFAVPWRQWTAGLGSAVACGLVGFMLGYSGHAAIPGVTPDTEQTADTALVAVLTTDLPDLDSWP